MGVRRFRMALVLVSLVAGLVAGGAGFDATASSNSNAPVVPGEIIVGLADGADVVPIARGLGATDVEPLLGGNAFVLSIPGDPFGVVLQARGLSGVRYAEPNYIRTLHATAPNDTDYGLKWDLHNKGNLSDGSDQAVADADIDFQEAYDALALGGVSFSTTIVAILDTGIDASHPDLNDKLVTGYDAFDGDNNPVDGFGHGTHVAGIAAAETNNSTGTAGVAFPSEVKIMPVKVCDDNGSCPTSAIVAGVDYAVRNGAKVINMSFGSSEPSQTEEDAFNVAHSAGVLLVASAGNSNVSTPNYPAAYEPAVMAIAATDWADGKASYSNYDANWVDLAAPGGDMDKYDDPEGIYSTMPTYNVYLTSCRARGLLSPCYDQHYDQLAGTSMAAPQVAGAAGLLFAIDSSLSNVDVRTLLQSTADEIDGTAPNKGTLWTNGRLNLDKAVTQVLSSGVNSSPTASFTYSCTDLNCSFTDTSTDSDGTITSWSWDFGDGSTSTAQNPSHSYTAESTYTVALTVTDDKGATGSSSQSVMVDDGINNPPTAAFTYSCTDLSCNFTDTSTDSDGTISSWSWDFNGDGVEDSAVQDPSYTYGVEGTYTVTLTVTDNEGATGSDSQSVTVTAPSAISLSVTFYKVRGTQTADLIWSGATSTNVDVYRNGIVVTTTANDGAYTDSTDQKGGGSATYQICEAGTTTCSSEVTGSW